MISQRAIRACHERFRLAPAELAPPPYLEILLDASLSMTSGDGCKEQLARELVVLLLGLAEAAGVAGHVHVVRGGDRDRRFGVAETAKAAQVPFDSRDALTDWHSDSREENVWRVVVSDLLFPGDPAELMPRWGRGVARLWIIQLLDPWESAPRQQGPCVLVDIETDEPLPAMLDAATVHAYTERLGRLQSQWQAVCARSGATLLISSDGRSLESVCGDLLVAAGLLRASEPRKV